MDAQIKKGVLEMCLLHWISQGCLYGYDIIQDMHEYFPEVNESTFYAILRRLHKEGAAVTSQGLISNGPARKYYEITEEGEKRLSQMKEDWSRLQEIVGQMGIR